MPSLKDIRRRITSVKNTRQITRAMKMVSAAKLRRAQDAILQSRPYAYRIYSILLTLAKGEDTKHPLLVQRPEKKALAVIIAGDRGLCGSFNANIFKEGMKFVKRKQAEGVSVELETIGKKSYDFFRKRFEIGAYHEGLLAGATYNKVTPITDSVLKRYAEGEVDAIYLIYNEFKSAIQQKVAVERLIPISLEAPEGVVGMMSKSEQAKFSNYLFEPSREELLNELIPRHFKMQFFRAVLESVASEHGARMSAMENATKNASEMIDSLTLEFNKARQASITKELMEIVGGVEAMR